MNNEFRASCRDLITKSPYNKPLSESEKEVVKKAFKDRNTHAKISEVTEARCFSKYNKLSASEVLQRMDEVNMQIRTLRAYMLAYGRDWNEDMGPLLQEIINLTEGYEVVMFTCRELITNMALKHYREERR